MENNYTESPASTIKNVSLLMGGILTYVAICICAIILLIMFFRGIPWIAENIFPLVMMAAGIAILLVVPSCLFLAIFKRSRGIGGMGLFISSYVIGISLWVWSLIVAYSLAGVFWMVVGLFAGGIGIVPIAFIASLLKAEWAIACQLLLLVVVVYALRGFGIFLSEKAS